jgi:hypothetical protein
MANTTIKYIVYTHTGSGRRHHHFGTQNNIINQASGHAVAGDVINALGIASLSFNGSNVAFAFMSVHGAADGNHLYTLPGNQTVAVGAGNIDILVVYAPPGGPSGPGGGPGVWVDAFNVDTGDFSDSDFIKVFTPPAPPGAPDSPKSSIANDDGEVSSLAAENLEAFATVDGASFVEWKQILPPETEVTTRLVPLAQNQSGEIWFAFYQATIHDGPGDIPGRIIQSIKHLREEVDLKMLPVWVRNPWCGNDPSYLPHVGPKGPNFKLSIPTDVIDSLRPAQRDKLRGYIKAYPALANAAYGEVQKTFGLLKDVGDLLSDIKNR